MHLTLSQHEGRHLKFENALRNPASPKHNHLLEIAHDAIDRMIMQSDLRDVYHGVHILGFENAKKSNLEQGLTADGVDTEFHIQLYDNNHNEDQLVEVFQRYLRDHDYSLGGTNLYSSKMFMEAMKAAGQFLVAFVMLLRFYHHFPSIFFRFRLQRMLE